jgi:hypothetical protein
MQYTAVLLAASAALVSSQKSAPAGYQWSVTNWQAGCTRECSYSFSITGPQVDVYPSFVATCSGTDTGAFTSCEVTDSSRIKGGYPTLISLVAPSTGDGAHLQVSLNFVNAGDGYVL